MARPTKYNEAMQAKAEMYVVSDFENDGSVIPSVEGLAEYLGASRSTLYLWKAEHVKFSDTLEDIESKQKRLTLNKGLTGDFAPTISKLVLANHGMHDKVDSSNQNVELTHEQWLDSLD